MRTFRLFKEIVGSYEAVGCTSIDFKNYMRDLRVYSDASDGHMLLHDFKNKQAYCEGFKFFYDADEENKLRRLIWKDEVSVKNCQMFGEAVFFNATYNTNRYRMIFTPFTGRDNHGKCVSFVAAIISREDVDSYAWVLDKFVKCIGHAPGIFITGRDPGLKKAIAMVWPDTYHMYCMWHIAMKVAEKLPVRLREDSEFKTIFSDIVWSDFHEPAEFEEKWREMIIKYELSDNRWFSDMFEDQSCWIPAYFRHISMSGLFRTMSLSESENSYFKRFLNKNSNLVCLYMNYNSAINAQRHTYQKKTLVDETSAPLLIPKSTIERHASSVYANHIFKEVQSEIESALVSCLMSKMDYAGPVKYFEVDDNVDGVFTANRIPEKYIVQRWCKLCRLSPQEGQLDVVDTESQNSTTGNNEFSKVASDCIGYVNNNKEARRRCLAELREVANKYSQFGQPNSYANTKQSLFQQFYWSTIPEVLSIFPPDVSKTKGSGVGGRRKSALEKASILTQKPMQTYRRCNTLGYHDSRNYPHKDVVEG